jgi:hypothetical protein
MRIRPHPLFFVNKSINHRISAELKDHVLSLCDEQVAHHCHIKIVEYGIHQFLQTQSPLVQFVPTIKLSVKGSLCLQKKPSER